jgi:hypothetical protein
LLSAKHIGTAGEHLVCSVLFGFGWSPSIIDAEGMDIVAVRNQDILRIQVKSTLKPLDEWSYQWQTSKSKPKRSLTIEDCDIVACVALDVRRIVFFSIDIISKQMTRRMPKSKILSPTIEEDSWETALGLAFKS